MKAILVVDVPDVCRNCILFKSGWDREDSMFVIDECMHEGKDLSKVKVEKEKPDWCPLRPLNRETLEELKNGNMETD